MYERQTLGTEVKLLNVVTASYQGYYKATPSFKRIVDIHLNYIVQPRKRLILNTYTTLNV